MAKHEKIDTPKQISDWLLKQIEESGLDYARGYYSIDKMFFNPLQETKHLEKKEIAIKFTIKQDGDICQYQTTLNLANYTDSYNKMDGILRFKDIGGANFIVEMTPNTQIRTKKIGTIYIFKEE
jgi:hypothetical protein